MDGLASIAEDLLPTDEALLSFIASQTANEGFQDCTATVSNSLWLSAQWMHLEGKLEERLIFADLPSVSRSGGTCVAGVGPDKIIRRNIPSPKRSNFVLDARL
jgi:hypothetical protein